MNWKVNNMQKIPEELQHKIDYINASNITASEKAACIAGATVQYWVEHYRKLRESK
jgi:hypothetical protein